MGCNISEELLKYFKKQRMTQEDIGQCLHISQQGVGAYLSGKKSFGKNAANKWSEAFGFRPGWLITGEGTMFPDGDPRNGQTIQANGDGSVATGNNSPVTISSENTVLEKMIKNLTEENISLRMKLLQMAEKLAAAGLPCDDEPCKP